MDGRVKEEKKIIIKKVWTKYHSQRYRMCTRQVFFLFVFKSTTILDYNNIRNDKGAKKDEMVANGGWWCEK